MRPVAVGTEPSTRTSGNEGKAGVLPRLEQPDILNAQAGSTAAGGVIQGDRRIAGIIAFPAAGRHGGEARATTGRMPPRELEVNDATIEADVFSFCPTVSWYR
jgi:hypothetical protein